MKTILIIIGIILLVLMFAKNNNLQSTDEETLLYIIHTHSGNIRCNYIDTRWDRSGDDKTGIIAYYDDATKQEEFIYRSSIDSITVLAESMWTCGPRSDEVKYIDKRKHK